MDVKVEELSTLTRKVTITIPAEEVQGRLDEAYAKLQKESKMKGFRKGKVPRSVIVKSYQGQVQGEVGEKLVQDTYFDSIEKQDFDPVVHPEITDATFNDDGSFTYVAQVDVRPVVELGTYKGIEVERPDNTVTDAAVDYELASMRRQMAVLKSVEDRPVAVDDVVVVDYQGFHKDRPMKHVKSEDLSVDVGSGQLDAEFENKLVGMKQGEEASYEVDFPESHPNPILAGKKVSFKVTVKDVKERVLAELDDEFAKDVNEQFTTLDELKNAIRERLQKEKEAAAAGEFNDRIMKKLLESHQFEVPERLVRFELDEIIKNTQERLEKNGMSLEAAGISREDLEKTNRPIAVQRVTGDFILKKIAEVEDIKVQDEDLERTFKRIGDQYNMPVSRVKEFFQNRDDLLPLMNEVLNEKILGFLKQEAQLIDPAPKADQPADGPAVQQEQDAAATPDEEKSIEK